MPDDMIEPEGVIQEIIRRINAGSVVVFCGAGISLGSGLPIVSQFMPYLFSKLRIHEDDARLLIDKEAGLQVPFELVIKHASRHSPIYDLFDMYGLGIPNTNHTLLARLAKTGRLRTIVTTNFDRLIEIAFANEGMYAGADYDLVFNDSDIDKIDWSKHRIRLIKIHGSIDDKKTMAMTLNQVASRQLSAPRNGIIRYVFSEGDHDSVLVLGYSCSDSFDLSPQIESIVDNQKKVFCLQHSQNPSVEHISRREFNNPFHHYVGGIRLYNDTDKAMERIWHSIIGLGYELRRSEVDWRRIVDEWYVKSTAVHSLAIGDLIAAEIYLEVSQYKVAERYFRKALRIGVGEHDEIIERIAREGIGDTCHARGRYTRALFYYIPALRLARRQKDRVSEAALLGDIGNVFYSKSRYMRAKKYYKQALHTLDEANLSGESRITDSQENIGKWLGSLGNVYHALKDHELAITHYEQARQVASNIGDKKSEGIWLGNMGTALKSLGKEEGKILHIHALEIALQVRDKQNELLWRKQLQSW